MENNDDGYNALNELFNESANVFFEKERQNILDNVAERNLCGRLAIYITSKLNEYELDRYYADPEYNRKQGGQVKTILDDEYNVINIQCDLIVHSRGEVPQLDNLIAIEMKKSSRPDPEKDADRKRLRAMTKTSYDGVWSYDGVTHPEHVCGYILGIYMILDIATRTCQIELYRHGETVGESIYAF